MKIDIMTLFPEMINAVMRESIIGRAQDKGVVEVKATNIRDYALDKHHKADDAPYGGGRGQVMLAEPLYLCHQALSAGEHVHTVFLSAQGQPFNQQKARELLAKEHFILVCGHYEGIDQRFIDECVDEEISIGDFVLTGGEIPAMAVADAVCRMVPGVLPDEEAFTAESHWDGLLEHPQYTRPENWRGREVPEVLLSGHHANIEAWRREMSLRRTKKDRPDLFAQFQPQDKRDIKILDKLNSYELYNYPFWFLFCCSNVKRDPAYTDSLSGQLQKENYAFVSLGCSSAACSSARAASRFFSRREPIK